MPSGVCIPRGAASNKSKGKLPGCASMALHKTLHMLGYELVIDFPAHLNFGSDISKSPHGTDDAPRIKATMRIGCPLIFVSMPNSVGNDQEIS
jgi:hypothetical protein